MTWALQFIEELRKGEIVKFRPTGSSMTPIIKSKQLCTVAPISDDTVFSVDDIVLCRVNNTDYLHLISNIQGDRYEISNNQGRANGWIKRDKIYGKLINVED